MILSWKFAKKKKTGKNAQSKTLSVEVLPSWAATNSKKEKSPPLLKQGVASILSSLIN